MAGQIAGAPARPRHRAGQPRRAVVPQRAVLPGRLLRHPQGRRHGRAAERAAQAGRDRLPPARCRRGRLLLLRGDAGAADGGDGQGGVRRGRGLPPLRRHAARSRRAPPAIDGATMLRRLRDRARRRACPPRPTRAGRHRGHPLHVGHDRAAEGRRADAPEHRAQRDELARTSSCCRAAASLDEPVVVADHAAAVPLVRPGLPAGRPASTAATRWCCCRGSSRGAVVADDAAPSASTCGAACRRCTGR